MISRMIWLSWPRRMRTRPRSCCLNIGY